MMLSADEQRVIGSRHEAAHALAYLYHGYSVDTIDVYESGDGLTDGGVRPIDRFDYNNVRMAGPAIELEWMTAHYGQEEGLQWALDAWESYVRAALDNEDPDDTHDVLIGGMVMRIAVPWAMAFVATNAELITELGNFVLESGGHVKAGEFMPLVEDRVQRVTSEHAEAAWERVQPHTERLGNIDRLISVWSALRDAG